MTHSGSFWRSGFPASVARCAGELGRQASSRRAGGCRASISTSRSPFSAPGRRASCRRSSTRFATRLRQQAPFELEPSGYRETRTVGMVVLRDPSGGAGRLAAGLHERLERIGVYRREARAWLPHVTVLRFRDRPRLRRLHPPFAAFAPSDAAAFLSLSAPVRSPVRGARNGPRWVGPSGAPGATGGDTGARTARRLDVGTPER